VRRAAERDVRRRYNGSGDVAELWRDELGAVLRQLYEIRFGGGRREVHRDRLDTLGPVAGDLAAMDVEDLGRVYERLLPLEPRIAREPMVRLRRGDLEAVVPSSEAAALEGGSRTTRIRPVEAIERGRFFTCAGPDRRTTGSYYTPRALVQFLVDSALQPLVVEKSPPGRPDPAALLSLAVLDPATGTGNFLCHACRVLGAALFRASRRRLRSDPEAVLGLPDDRLLADLLSRDEAQAMLLCRRWAAAHCLYGVDLDPFALEITGLALRAVCGWPDREATLPTGRLVCGDALDGALPAPPPDRPGGWPFDAVVGNPPWEALRPRAKEFFARYDLRVLDAPTRRERRRIEQRLEKNPAVARARERYEARLRQLRQTYDRRYRWQTVEVAGRRTSGDPDQWKLFMERSVQLVRPGGWVAMLVPSAFHTNASATGIRRLFLEQMDLRCCHSLHNRRGLFDIHRSFKFDAVVARRDDGGTGEFECSFRVEDPVEIGKHPLTFTRGFVEQVGGGHLAFPELRSADDVAVTETAYRSGDRLGTVCDRLGIQLRSSLHMTNDAHRFTPTPDVLPAGADPRDPDVADSLLGRGFLPLHEGKTFHQYDDRWSDRPRYLVHLDRIGGADRHLRATRHYRLAFRGVASSTNERTSIFTVLPPGVLCGNSAPAEARPWRRPDRAALLLCALCNSLCVDYLMRVRASANLNLFIVRQTALPPVAGIEAFLVHSALRLSCNHRGYAPLWHGQLGTAWREPSAAEVTWPVLATPQQRQALRSAVDAVVAHAFGLSRPQFQRVLSSFSHSGCREAPSLCIEAFDEIARDGLGAFVRRHDPYADIPLADGEVRAAPPGGAIMDRP